MTRVHENGGTVPGRAYRLLVVDDYPDARAVLCDVLRAYGHDVFEAADAEGALAVLHSEAGFSAVLTDVEMPGTMDGLALAAVIRLRWPTSKVLALSANEHHRLRVPDGVPFLKKPYVVEALLRKLDVLLAEAQ